MIEIVQGCFYTPFFIYSARVIIYYITLFIVNLNNEKYPVTYCVLISFSFNEAFIELLHIFEQNDKRFSTLTRLLKVLKKYLLFLVVKFFAKTTVCT